MISKDSGKFICSRFTQLLNANAPISFNVDGNLTVLTTLPPNIFPPIIVTPSVNSTSNSSFSPISFVAVIPTCEKIL